MTPSEPDLPEHGLGDDPAPPRSDDWRWSSRRDEQAEPPAGDRTQFDAMHVPAGSPADEAPADEDATDEAPAVPSAPPAPDPTPPPAPAPSGGSAGIADPPPPVTGNGGGNGSDGTAGGSPPRSRRRVRAIIAGAAIVVILAVVAGILLANGNSTTTTAHKTTTTKAASNALGCPTGRWPLIDFAQPTGLKDGGPLGYYIWKDLVGWHLRVVDPSASPTTFSGTITSSGRVLSAQPFPADGPARVSLQGNRITFLVPGANTVRGVDVGLSCASTQIRFDLNGGNGPWPTDSIFVGKESRAVANPLVITREK